MTQSIKSHILAYLSKEGPQWGGRICRDIHDLTGHKESVIERRLRELYQENMLDRCYKQIDGVGPSFVRYRIKQTL